MPPTDHRQDMEEEPEPPNPRGPFLVGYPIDLNPTPYTFHTRVIFLSFGGIVFFETSRSSRTYIKRTIKKR